MINPLRMVNAKHEREKRDFAERRKQGKFKTMAKDKMVGKQNEVEAPKVQEAPKPEPPKTAEPIKVSEVKLKQSVLNLESGEETDIEFSQKRYSADEFNAATLEAAKKLVGSAEEQTKALLAYATSQSYQIGRAEALSKGNFLTSELRQKIVIFMRAQAAFADLSAKDAFERWKNGFLAGKAGAKKVLDLVRAEDTDINEL